MYWYNDEGKERDVFVSSRVRLARNLADYPFEPYLTDKDAAEIIDKVRGALNEKKGYSFIDFSALAENEKLSMVERHLVSPDMAEKTTRSAIVENEQEGLFVMLCEEDHVRIQAIRTGFDIQGAFKSACKADDLIDAAVDVAYDEKLGYITHCPTNLGTGMRASVMMFLPALTMTGRIKGIQNQLTKLGLCVRGMTGEGSAAKGCLYQFSNSVTQGVSEEDIITNLEEAVKQIASKERDLRKELLCNSSDELRDRVMRAWGTMKYAWILSSDEMLRLYADVRLGVSLGIITEIDEKGLDSLIFECMPATLCVSAGGELPGDKRDRLRAQKIRERLA